MRIDNVHGDS